MKYCLLCLLLFVVACHTATTVRQKNLSHLNGKWALACSGPIGQPGALDCPEMEGFQIIRFDPQRNVGEFNYHLPGQQLDVDFKVLEEDGKWFVFYVDEQGNTSKGEIVRLNAKELQLHYAKEGIMTIQRRTD